MTSPREQEIRMIFSRYVAIRRDLQKSKPKLSKKGRAMIEKALDRLGYESLDLIFLYFAEARDDYTRFMRGDNDLSKDYVKLDSLLRPTKLDEKLVRAKRWRSRGSRSTEEHIREAIAPKPKEDPDLFLPLQFVGGDE